MSDFPNDWRTVRLSDAGRWLSGGTPSTNNPRYWGGEIPWISATSLKDFRVFDSTRRLTKLGAKAGTRLIPAGTTIFVVRGMSLKTEFRVGLTETQVAFGQDCKALIPAAGIDARFLALAIKAKSNAILQLVDEAGHGTGRLPTGQLFDLTIGVPLLEEQRRIAEVLDAADEAIRSTERIVVKLEQAKQGLLRDLLTQGIDESGCLRDSNKLVESAVGRIPRQWTVARLAEVSGITSGSTPSRSVSTFWQDGSVPWVKTGEINFSTIYETEEKVTLSARAQTGLQIHPVGTVLVAMYGQGITRGRCAILGLPAAINQACAAILPRGELVATRYLFQYLRFSYERLRSLGHGSQQLNLSSSLLGDMHISIPPMVEQELIADRLESIDRRIERESQAVRGLRLAKQGLMDDLLTGRVRV